MSAHNEQVAAEVLKAARLGWCGKAGVSSDGKSANGIAVQYLHSCREEEFICQE